MDIKYRKAKVGDVSFIIGFLKSVSGNIEDIDAGQFLIAEDGDKIIGCVRIQNKDGNFKLASLAVLQDYRKRGIGTALIAKILEDNRERPVYLFCNIKNQGFYEKFGFKKIEVGDMPDVLQKDYNKLLNSNFAGNIKLLVAMVLL